jgi:hypothetical protein
MTPNGTLVYLKEGKYTNEMRKVLSFIQEGEYTDEDKIELSFTFKGGVYCENG